LSLNMVYFFPSPWFCFVDELGSVHPQEEWAKNSFINLNIHYYNLRLC
jgi:hypothetical protein